MEWINEPAVWTEEHDTVTVTAEAGTDIWRQPGEGGIRDSGHMLVRPVTGNFTAEATIVARYVALYDQAGLMVRLDETTWMKCGIEYMHGIRYASAVVTREWSDWSIAGLPDPPAVRFRVVRRGATVEVYYSLGGGDFAMIRKAWLTDVPTVCAGLMCACPKGDGLTVSFEGFSLCQP